MSLSGGSRHPIARATSDHNDRVDRDVFEISCRELCLADEYEVAENHWRQTTLASGTQAWAYVARS